MVEADKTQQLDEIPLYRYLTFDKFLETLDKGLFIPKASLFKDRWEAMAYEMHEYLKERNTDILLKEPKVSTLNDFCIPDIHKHIREGMKEVYVSCWNRSDHECVAMWNFYGKGENAVMLETNAKELTDAFVCFNKSENEEWMAHLTRLRYVIPGNDSYDIVFKGEDPLWESGFKDLFSNSFRFHRTYTGLQYKHISYSFEKEYRLLAAHKDRGERQNEGIILPLKKSFIKRVILQSGSSDIFQGVVRDCLKKYDFNDVMVEKSLIDELPPLEG